MATTTTTTTSTTKSLVFATTFTAQATVSAPITVVFQPPTPTTTLGPTTIELSIPPQTVHVSDIKTYTHVDATYYFANPNGLVTSTYTTEFLYGPSSERSSAVESGEDKGDGWDSWSTGAKAGLIVGVVVAALVLVWLCMCCYKRNTAWVAHDWRWAGAVEGR